LFTLAVSDVDISHNSSVDVKSNIAPIIVDHADVAMFAFTSRGEFTTLTAMSDFGSMEKL
jgi:hypothetical protein